MSDANPYESPKSDETSADPRPDGLRTGPDTELSASGTIVPRHIAAIVDNAVAMLLSLLAAKSLPDEWPLLQAAALVGIFLGYYFLGEALVGRTPGKLFAGLAVARYDGRLCTWRQALIRTLFRLLEVNPILFGALPAALVIIRSSHHQRMGDMVAKTMVVHAGQLVRGRS